jgi:hypothetical protein
MQPRRRSAGDAPGVSSAATAVGVAVASATLIAVGACARGASWPKPVPTLASSPQAATAFEQIREAWGDPEHTNADSRRRLLEGFLARFPSDGLVPLARVYLALVAMQQGDFAATDTQLAASENLPPGTARDLWTVACARRLRLRGAPDTALELIRPLVGKNVDPVTRTVFEEELALAALATHRDYEAISYMDTWLRASSEEDKSKTMAAVRALVERLPKEVLVGALQALRTQRATFGYGLDIERILAGRLAQIATESGDAELARLLLDPDAGTIVVAGEAGVELSALATSRRGLNIVEGRTIGLLLPTESPGLRDESADVLRGVMWALGLPRGLRNVQAHGGMPEEGGAPATRAACAPLEPAPLLVDPRPEERLRLVSRDDAGSAARTEVSLDELAGEGAAVVIAGLDAQTATRALRWGQDHGIAVVSLVPPAQGQGSPFGFVLGESRESVLYALARAVPSIASEPVAPIIDVSEVPLYPPQGGRVGLLTLLLPISCDIPATGAGDPRFPITDWDRNKIRAWLVSGSPGCAQDVVGELSAAHARGVVALTLEAAALPAHASGLRVVTASAGAIPGGLTSDARDDELQAFSSTLGGNVSWWTALGRDAATLARVAMDQLPIDAVTEARTVTDRRAHARDLLGSARARLWSTEKATWTDTHTMTRTVCAVEVPVK